MKRRIRKLAYVALAVSLFGGPSSGDAAESGPNVLILQSLDAQASPYVITTGVFRQRFQAHYDLPVAFAEIALDAWWGGRLDREPYQVQLIHNRIADQPPDLIVNMGPAAIDFWLRNRQLLPFRIPTIMVAREGYLDPGDLAPGDTGIVAEFEFTRVVDEIVDILPETRRVVVAFGASELERNLTTEARKALTRFGNRIEFSYTSDLSMPEVETLVRDLPEHSAVLFGIFSIDARGLILPLYTGLDTIVAASSAPVFGVFDHQIGRGIVGGTLIPTEGMAGGMVAAARELFEQPAKAPAVRVIPLTQPTYDWRALHKWRIDARSLPANSRILFQEPTLWSRYSGWLLLAGTLLVVQSVSIAALLIQRRRRQAAERTGARLSSRLITAHEDERSSLARELHDDLSQRLAGMAIDAAFLSSDPGTTRDSDALTNLHSELVRMSKDVHDMSYRLHPSMVGELGLVTALRTEVDRIHRRSGCFIDDHIEDIADSPPPEASLCLYRIAQESLYNTLKYAHATIITVTFRQNGKSLLLEVRDNGKGFDVRELEFASGIGISGMRERARLAGGALRVISHPGRGTTIIARVPTGAP